MSTTERPEFVPAGAGLAATIAHETHGDLADPGPIAVRARGYWEQVWIRFRRDKVAIAGGVFIVVLIFAAFAGGSCGLARRHSPHQLSASPGTSGSARSFGRR